MNKYAIRLMVLGVCSVFSDYALADSLRGGTLEYAVIFVLFAPASILTLCLGSWFVGKGNRKRYTLLGAPLVVLSLCVSWIYYEVGPFLYTILFISLIPYIPHPYS